MKFLHRSRPMRIHSPAMPPQPSGGTTLAVEGRGWFAKVLAAALLPYVWRVP